MIESLEVPVWWNKSNGAWLRRDALDSDHPESTYQYIKRTYGASPEEYGIFPNVPERSDADF